MKERLTHFVALQLLGLLSVLPVAAAQNYNWTDDLSLSGDWTVTYYSLDKAAIASALGLNEAALTASVTIYSVKQDGTLVAPSSSYAGADGNYGDWHDANGYSLGGWSGSPSFFHVVNYNDLTIGMGQNPNAGLQYGDSFQFQLVVKCSPAEGDNAELTLNVTYTIYKEPVEEETDIDVLRFKAEGAIRSARLQAENTDYDGKAALMDAIAEATAALSVAETIADLQTVINDMNAAQTTYLANRPDEWLTIKNGNAWTATNTGETVHAGGPGFIRVGDVWYMCGEDRAASPSAPWTPDVNLYSSVDLQNWKFERKIIQNGVTASELGNGRFIERPKLLYNPNTGKYVVWCHYEQGNYGASEAACFECDSVNGPYTKIWSGQPLSTKSRDCNVFQDDDGTAYFISTTDENTNLGLFRLSDDYHSAVEKTTLFSGQRREAPAIVRIGNRYFMFNSACSGWEPNQCKMSYTTNLKSGWTSLTNVGNYYAYDTQAAAILTIKGTKATTYLYVGDRWYDPDLVDTKTIIFPVSFVGGTMVSLDYRERFDINFVTGEWRETPTEGLFADRTQFTVKAVSSEHTSYPATAAIDGNVNTFWRSSSDYDDSSDTQSLTIDMGSSQKIKGVVITPRLDYSAGLIRNCLVQTSTNGVRWSTAKKIAWLPYWTELTFAETTCRYIRISKYDGGAASIAEVNVLLAQDAANGIEEAIAGKCANGGISRCECYTFDGRRVEAPGRGVYIERLTYANGTVSTRKRTFRQ